MSCNENKHHGSSHCVVDVVKFINELQDCSTTTCGSGCEIPFLGAHILHQYTSFYFIHKSWSTF